MAATGRETSAFVADGEAVWFWRPEAGVKFARRQRVARMTGQQSGGPRGERGVSRKTIAWGMPDVSGASAVNTHAHTKLLSAHEAAGALGTRHSPRPLLTRATRFPTNLGRGLRREIAMCWFEGGAVDRRAVGQFGRLHQGHHMSQADDPTPSAAPEPPPGPVAAPPQRNGCLTACLVLVGLVLLLPGLCTMAFFRGATSDPTMSLIALITFAVALGGIALIAFALQRTGR